MVLAVLLDKLVDRLKGADAVVKLKGGVNVDVDDGERPRSRMTKKTNRVDTSSYNDVMLDVLELVDEILAQYYAYAASSSAYAVRPKGMNSLPNS